MFTLIANMLLGLLAGFVCSLVVIVLMVFLVVILPPATLFYVTYKLIKAGIIQ